VLTPNAQFSDGGPSVTAELPIGVTRPLIGMALSCVLIWRHVISWKYRDESLRCRDAVNSSALVQDNQPVNRLVIRYRAQSLDDTAAKLCVAEPLVAPPKAAVKQMLNVVSNRLPPLSAIFLKERPAAPFVNEDKPISLVKDSPVAVEVIPCLAQLD
jgi:hypothetical protein